MPPYKAPELHKIYSSMIYGDYEVVEDLGRMTREGSTLIDHYVKIRFLKTGGEAIADMGNVKIGSVRDPLYGYDPNKIFQSYRCGPFKMIEYLGLIDSQRKILVQFLNTKSIVETTLANIRNGSVMDPALDGMYSYDYDPSRYDNYEDRINGLLKEMYETVVRRCHNKIDPSYDKYGGNGVIVCDEWRNDINQFIQDAKTLYGYDKFYNNPYLYSIDKDFKQILVPKNQRIYSKETCMFLSKIDNSNLARIEEHIAHPEMRYFGVNKRKGENRFLVRKIMNYHTFYLGTYTNEIAAANVYNWWELYWHTFELVPLLNDNIPFMSPNEFIKYNVNPKQICHTVAPEADIDAYVNQMQISPIHIPMLPAKQSATTKWWPNPYMYIGMPRYQPIVYW